MSRSEQAIVSRLGRVPSFRAGGCRRGICSPAFPCEWSFFLLRNLFKSSWVVLDYGVFGRGDFDVGNPLQTLLELPDQERAQRGLEHTPREIWQQPETWGTTYRVCAARQADLNDALRRAGIGRGSTASPTVYLVGAGTSDYS